METTPTRGLTNQILPQHVAPSPRRDVLGRQGCGVAAADDSAILHQLACVRVARVLDTATMYFECWRRRDLTFESAARPAVAVAEESPGRSGGRQIVLTNFVLLYVSLWTINYRLPPGWTLLQLAGRALPAPVGVIGMQRPLFSAVTKNRAPRRGTYWLISSPLFWFCALGLAWVLWFAYQLYQRSPAPDIPKEYQRLLQTQPAEAFCSLAAPPLVCAHGGDTTKHHPNTREAFLAALAVGADCAEVDVSPTADGFLVNLHARELQQLLQKQHAQVPSLRLSELLSLRWPNGEGLLTVRQAVELLAPRVRLVILDVKTPLDKKGRPLDELKVAGRVVDLVRELNCTNCLIWAKSDAVVQHVKKALPHVLAGYVVMRHTPEALADGMNKPLRLKAPEVIAVHHEMVDAAFTREMHAAGKQVHVWTVGSSPVMKGVLDAGVDALVTNHPGAAVAAVRAFKQKCSSSQAKARR